MTGSQRSGGGVMAGYIENHSSYYARGLSCTFAVHPGLEGYHLLAGNGDDYVNLGQVVGFAKAQRIADALAAWSLGAGPAPYASQKKQRR